MRPCEFSAPSRLKRGLAFVMMCSVCVANAAVSNQPGTVTTVKNKVQLARPPSLTTNATNGLRLEFGDRVTTFDYSSAIIEWRDLTLLRLGELTSVQVMRPSSGGGRMRLDRGRLFWFNRRRNSDLDFETPTAIGATRGTEFELSVEATRTVLRLLDGSAELRNTVGTIQLTSGETGIAEPGRAPYKAALLATNTVQWWLFYPAVLDVHELNFADADRLVLSESLSAYGSGDLLRAVAAYPAGRTPASPDEAAYAANLALCVGSAERAWQLVRNAADVRSVRAVRLMTAAVNQWTNVAVVAPGSASEHLALSFLHQSRHELSEALSEAQRAADLSPEFAFAWARVAELLFTFRRVPEAERAVQEAIQLAPRHAEAQSLRGFLLAANGEYHDARSAFEAAITLDPLSPNAWLGRGLIKIHAGDREGGRADLQQAAVLQPDRALLRSYLGRAFQETANTPAAYEELTRAQRLDDRDPTAWLYSAFVNYEQNRVNEAVRDLERSIALNDNRAVYRPRLALDEDLAVRGAGLARIYQRAGLPEVALREAARAVSYDYASYSAHLFLAESFGALRDPTRFNLRYETVWFNELLLGYLLAPVAAGPFSPNLSQQEYTRLFTGNRLGLNGSSEYRSDGQFRQLLTHYGVQDRMSWSVDFDGEWHSGVRPNNELSRSEVYTQLKHQFTPNDNMTLLTKVQEFDSGDNFQHFDPKLTQRRHYDAEEEQLPLAALGWHHEWSPGVHTLALGGRLQNEQSASDRDVRKLIFTRDVMGDIIGVEESFAAQEEKYSSNFETYFGELSQVFENERNTFVGGARAYHGEFETRNFINGLDASVTNFFSKPPWNVKAEEDFDRLTFYAYDFFRPFPSLVLIGGIAYENLTYPANLRSTPITRGSADQDQFSPKAGLVWAPMREFALRGMYARSLGGVSFDESYRLEPVQLAGFSQSYRSLASESVVGSLAGQELETAGAAIDLKFASRTYVGFQTEWLNSELNHSIGAFNLQLGFPPAGTVSATSERLAYRERSVGATVDQLLGDWWVIGVRYKFTDAELHRRLPEGRALPGAEQFIQADLHELGVRFGFNHPSGLFARADSMLVWQPHVAGVGGTTPENLTQMNVRIGYRFRRNRGEVSMGVVNLLDDDYRLHPLTVHEEFPRERVFVARLQFNL